MDCSTQKNNDFDSHTHNITGCLLQIANKSILNKPIKERESEPIVKRHNKTTHGKT